MKRHLGFFIPILLINGCTPGAQPKEEITVQQSHARWPIDARQPCIESSIKIHFKSGNERIGYLAAGNDPFIVSIRRTTDEGIYNIHEIQWIECNARIAYP